MIDRVSRHARTKLRPLAALGAALALTGVAAPVASADASQLFVASGLDYPAVLPASGVATKVDVITRVYDNTGQNAGTAHGITVTVAFAAGGPATGTSSYPGCTDNADGSITCQIASIPAGYENGVDIPIMVTGQAGTPDGTDAGMTVAVTATDATPQNPAPDLMPLTVEDRPNIVPGPLNPPLMSVARGQRADLPQLTVTNTGTQPAEGLTIVFDGAPEAPLHAAESNCQTGSGTASGVTVCYVDAVIQPGETYRIVNAPTFRMRTDTVYTPPGQLVDVEAANFSPGDEVASSEAQFQTTFTAGTGKPLTLVRTVGTGTPQTTSGSVQQQNFSDNFITFSQSIRASDGLSTNLVAVGGKAVATSTTPATVNIGVKNAGAAWMIDHEGTGIGWLHFTVPAGATVTEASDACEPLTTDGTYPPFGSPGYSDYACQSQSLLPHASQLWTFKMTLAAGVTKATGSATIQFIGDGGPGPFPAWWDTNTADDTAAVTVTAG